MTKGKNLYMFRMDAILLHFKRLIYLLKSQGCTEKETEREIFQPLADSPDGRQQPAGLPAPLSPELPGL